MPRQLTCFRVFIASPGGLEGERKAFRDEIQDYNDTDAIERGVYFLATGWEDTIAGIGRPQALINEDVRESDYLVLLLWDRWGSPPDAMTSPFSSGTEEEYDVALKCYEDTHAPMRQVVMMFKAVSPHQMSDPGPQLQRVLDFRKEIENQKQHLFHSFDSVDAFRHLLRKHLAAWLRDLEKTENQKQGPPAGPTPPSEERAALKNSELPAGLMPFRGALETVELRSADHPDGSATGKAWELADAGRLTDAEVEFSKLTVGRSEPAPLVEYGRFLLRLGRLAQATVLFERAATTAGDHGDQRNLANSYVNLGIVRRTSGDLDGAEQMFRKALEIDQKVGRPDGIASSYGNVGIVLEMRGDLDGAEHMLRKALEIDQKLGRLHGMASAYGNLGIVLGTRGDLDGAEQMYRKALEVNEKLGRLEGLASNHTNLGSLLGKRGDLDGAEQMHRKGLENSSKVGDLEAMATNYGGLGIVLLTRGDLTGAEQMYREALQIDQKRGREGRASHYVNLGNLLNAQGDLDAAEQMHRKGLEIHEKLGNLEDMAIAYSNLAVVLQKRGDLDGAEQLHRKAVEISEQVGSLVGLATNYNNLGNVLAKRGNLADAEEIYRKALHFAERIGSPELIASFSQQLKQDEH